MGATANSGVISEATTVETVSHVVDHKKMFGLFEVSAYGASESVDGANAVSLQYLAGDVPSAARYGNNLSAAPPLAGRAYGLVWLSSAGGVFTGIHALLSGIQGAKDADQVGDTTGSLYHRLVSTRGVFEFLTAAIFTVIAANMIFGFIPPAILAHVTVAGIVAVSVMFTMFVLHFGLRAHEANIFSTKLEAIMNDPKSGDAPEHREKKAFEHLQAAVTLSGDEITRVACETNFCEYISLFPQESKVEEQRGLVERYADKDALHRTLDEISKVAPRLKSFGKSRGLQKQELLLDKLHRHIVKKHAVVSRVLDGGAVESIRNACAADRKTTIEKVRGQARWNLFVFATVSAISVFAVMTFAIVGAAHAGMLAHVGNGLMLTTGVLLFCVDSYFMSQSLRYGKPSATDQRIMTLMTVALIASAIAALIISHSPAVHILAGALIAWHLALYMASQYAWSRNNKPVDFEPQGTAGGL